jgi:NADH dehydrogenase [ubiquinone] 1 alpha subcomplex assembly factor 7
VSTRVAEAIRERIRASGPIHFDVFMELALYGPGGFYEGTPIGPEGSFVTSPHVHPVFGELLAAGVRELWVALGRPSPPTVVEVGAGDGTLAAQLVDALSDLEPEYIAIDRSPGARQHLQSRARIQVADEIPSGASLVLAHELLDNLPFRWMRGTSEVRVDWNGDRFVQVEADADPALLELTGASEVDRVVPAGALAFVDQLADRLGDPAYALLIDYGSESHDAGTPHGYRSHRQIEDVLDDPGSMDITAGVDFGMLADRARARGLVAFPSVTQRHALTELGLEPWIRNELARQAELLGQRQGLQAVRAWSGKSRATLLVDPAGLGRLRWMLLGSGDVTAPSFIA